MEVWFLRVHPPGQSLRIPGRGSRARRERGALLGVGLGLARGVRLRGGGCGCGWRWAVAERRPVPSWGWRCHTRSRWHETCVAVGGCGLWRPLRLWARESGRERAPPPPTLHTRRHAPLWARAVRAARPPLPLSAARDAGVCALCVYKAPRNGSCHKVSHDLKITQSRDCNGHGQWQEDGRKLLRIDRAPRPP